MEKSLEFNRNNINNKHPTTIHVAGSELMSKNAQYSMSTKHLCKFNIISLFVQIYRGLFYRFPAVR